MKVNYWYFPSPPFRFNTGEYIQMVTALVLQLIQCVVVLPANADEPQKDAYDEEELEGDESKKEVV